MRPLLRTLLRALLATSMIASGAVWADELAEVQRLQSAGRLDEALQRAERTLQSRPQDAAMRFQRGVLLADLRRSAEATDVFQRLAQDYPQLAEPHNNLAGLYAAAGDYDRARASLDQALRLDPNLAAAHQNLGDVFALLAARSYARALQLEPNNSALPAKLALVRQLVTPLPR